VTTFDLSDPAFEGFNEPSRLEADVFDLGVEGALPPELNGAWYRLGPDPQFVPHRRHLFFGGDGMVSMFLFDEGSVRYRSRYVRTERLMLERAAGRALFGEYRNPFSDEPAVQGRSRATVNTTVIEHAGLLWALKEDSPRFSSSRSRSRRSGCRPSAGA
jgi:carotenoid cleavage dioxygenase